MSKETHSSPPSFTPDGDLQEWRRKVVRWVDLIKTAAEKGDDRHYKTVWATLGRWLYRGLPSAQQSIVDEAQVKGVINYKQDDQVAAVRDIVELVAVDPPIAMVSRLISSFNKVSSCRRKKNEDLSMFVSRFRGLSAEHLMHSHSSSSSQIGEVLAITLLNNANLEEGTLTNAKLQLISLAEARSRNEKNSESISISKESLEVLSKISAEFQDALEAPATSRGDLGRRFLLDFRSDCLPLIAKMTETLRHINQEHQAGTKDDVSGLVLSKQNRCKLHLEDAVSVLGNLTLTSGGPSATFSMKEVETLTDRNVQKDLLSVSQTVAHPSSADFRSSKEQ